MAFKIKIEPEAYQDIQEGIDWYNRQQPGLGRKFHAELKTSFKKLKTNPFFSFRYDMTMYIAYLSKSFPT